jgi:hypothetical protein
MNAPHQPRPTALWLLTLVVLLAHLGLLHGSLSALVLSPGARTSTQTGTVLLQLQPTQDRPAPSPQTSVTSKAKPSSSTPPKSTSITTSTPASANTASAEALAASDISSTLAADTADAQALTTNTNAIENPQGFSPASQAQIEESATNSIAKTPPSETGIASGPVVTEAGSYPPVAVPGPLKLLYKLQGQAKGFNYSAKGELLWLPAGQRYEARLEISAFLLGSRVQTSRGEITANGLQPQRFSDKVRSEVAAHFDWAQRKVIFSANTPQADLQNGAQDHLSAFIALASLLAGDLPRYLPDGEIRLQAIGPREADMWRVLMGGEETLDLPVGQLPTYKLTRPPVKPYDLNVELWMAPSLGFLPARIRLTQHNGDFIDQLLQSSAQP